MLKRGLYLLLIALVTILIMYLLMIFVLPVNHALGIASIIITWIIACIVLLIIDESQEGG